MTGDWNRIAYVEQERLDVWYDTRSDAGGPGWVVDHDDWDTSIVWGVATWRAAIDAAAAILSDRSAWQPQPLELPPPHSGPHRPPVSRIREGVGLWVDLRDITGRVLPEEED